MAGAAFSQVHKCQTSGKTTYQATPCDGEVVAKKVIESKAPVGLPWAGLKAGMTTEEVQRTLVGMKLEKYRDKDLLTKGISIAGHLYEEGHFSFKDEKFVQFHATSGFGSSGLGLANAQTKSIFEKTVDDLRRQLGSEASLTITENPRMLSADAEWRINGGRVNVGISPITALTSQLLINYFSGR